MNKLETRFNNINFSLTNFKNEFLEHPVLTIFSLQKLLVNNYRVSFQNSKYLSIYDLNMKSIKLINSYPLNIE